jgi:hypothetical protein
LPIHPSPRRRPRRVHRPRTRYTFRLHGIGSMSNTLLARPVLRIKIAISREHLGPLVGRPQAAPRDGAGSPARPRLAGELRYRRRPVARRLPGAFLPRASVVHTLHCMRRDADPQEVIARRWTRRSPQRPERSAPCRIIDGSCYVSPRETEGFSICKRHLESSQRDGHTVSGPPSLIGGLVRNRCG